MAKRVLFLTRSPAQPFRSSTALTFALLRPLAAPLLHSPWMRVRSYQQHREGKRSGKYSDDGEDTIEAEVLHEHPARPSSTSSAAASWWEKAVAGVKSGVQRAKQLVGLDEESVRKREQRKRVDREIDTLLQGTGILGSVLGRIIKRGAHKMTESIEETSEDFALVKECTEITLLNDRRVRQRLVEMGVGENIRCAPFSTSMSSVTDQTGPSRKQCSLSMHVLEDSEAAGRSPPLGVVTVEAVLLDKSQVRNKYERCQFKSVLFQDSSKGPILHVDHESIRHVREINV